MAVHYAQSVIAAAQSDARRAVASAATDDATAAFKRLALVAVPATVAFVMGEVNLATPPARIESAIARTIGWMAATMAANAQRPEGALTTIFAQAQIDAARYLANPAVRPPAEEGGHA